MKLSQMATKQLLECNNYLTPKQNLLENVAKIKLIYV